MNNCHSVYRIKEYTVGIPMFVIGAGLLIITLVHKCLPQKLIKRWGYTLSSWKLEVDQKLPGFSEAVSLRLAHQLEGEKFYYDRYDIRLVPDYVIRHFKQRQNMVYNPMSTVPWYHMIYNYDYMRDFNYIPSTVPDRKDFIP